MLTSGLRIKSNPTPSCPSTHYNHIKLIFLQRLQLLLSGGQGTLGSHVQMVQFHSVAWGPRLIRIVIKFTFTEWVNEWRALSSGAEQLLTYTCGFLHHPCCYQIATSKGWPVTHNPLPVSSKRHPLTFFKRKWDPQTATFFTKLSLLISTTKLNRNVSMHNITSHRFFTTKTPVQCSQRFLARTRSRKSTVEWCSSRQYML